MTDDNHLVINNQRKQKDSEMFGRKTADYEKPFSAKYAEERAAVASKILSKADYDRIMQETPRPDRTLMPNLIARPGDNQPKPYIDTTRTTLEKTIDTYTKEIAALDKDIAKLTEERRQAQIAVDGMKVALAHIDEFTLPPDNAQWTEEEVERIAAQGVKEALTPNKIHD